MDTNGSLMTGNFRSRTCLGQAFFGEPGVEIVQDNGGDDDGADDDLAVILIDAENYDAARNHLNDQCAKNDPHRRAAPAAETGAADNGGRNDVEFITLAVTRGRRSIVAQG